MKTPDYKALAELSARDGNGWSTAALLRRAAQFKRLGHDYPILSAVNELGRDDDVAGFQVVAANKALRACGIDWRTCADRDLESAAECMDIADGLASLERAP